MGFEVQPLNTARSGKPERQADHVYRELKASLYLVSWALPGQKLTEHGLSGVFGTSRAPVREALQRLVQEQYLAAHFRSGYTVMTFSERAFQELTEVRIMLECQALQAWFIHPIQNPDAETRIRNLRQTWSHPNGSDSATEVTQLNLEFHTDLVALACNRQLQKVHADVLERVEVVQRLDFKEEDRVETTYREHQSILDAMVEGQIDVGMDRLSQHIQRSTDSVKDRSSAYFSGDD